LNFGNVNIGVEKQDSVTITNTGTSDLIINSVSSSNPLFTVASSQIILSQGASRKVYVTFSPLANGMQNGYIYFSHNALNGLDSVSVSGTTGISPIFTVNISNLDFGTLLIGTTKQKSVIVTNTGTIDLKISDIISSDNHYTITPIINTIVPGASVEFFITFKPTVVGQVNGTIQFNHNAGRDIINVTGNGIQVISIKDARELPIGTEFAIEGIVTRSLGSYTRIQDQTAAITIIQESGEFFNEVENLNIKMTDIVRIQGRISEDSFLKVIQGDDLTGYLRLSRGNVLPTPVKVTLAEIAMNGEKYESRLITLENLTIPSVKDITFKAATIYQTTDNSDNTNSVVIRIGNSEDTQTDGMPFISTSVTFEGVLSQSSQTDPTRGYQLTPVLTTDLRFVLTGVMESISAHKYLLSDNFPNPFETETTINYSVEKANHVTLKVLDALGNEVTTLVNKYQNEGDYSVSFSSAKQAIPLVNGIYFYRLEVGTFMITKQMILLK
jgi:hypothetical protein